MNSDNYCNNARRLIQHQTILPKTYHTRLNELRKANNVNNCCDEIVKKSNAKYHNQGAVDSSLRINHLKYDNKTKVNSTVSNAKMTGRDNLQSNDCEKCVLPEIKRTYNRNRRIL
tara:strand:- start:72 stop:416 length:345 start_codon:yes stop_codon:yes gene_type:complete